MLQQLFAMILRGIIIGVVVSAPMGPVGIFCIQRTLDKGRLSGFYTGVGAAISDLIYCILTGFCLSFIEEFINVHRAPIQLLGSFVLIGFGTWLVKKQPDATNRHGTGPESASPESDIPKGFALTFSNPLILFLIIGLFAQFNFVIEGMTFWHYVLGFIGIIAGALGWWWVVTYFVDKLRCHFNLRTMKMINTVVGIIILTFAAIGVISATSAYAQGQQRPAPRRSADVCFRVADKAMKGWQAEVCDSLGDGFVLGVSHVRVDDPFGDTECDALDMLVSDRLTGDTLARIVASEGLDPYKGKNAWRLMRDGDVWNLYAGNREYAHRMRFRKNLGPVLPPRALTSGQQSVDFETTRVVAGNQEAPGIVCVGEGEIMQRLTAGSAVAVCGVYSLFDYEQDDAYARIGGRYRLAVIPRQDDSFDIVYIGGAVARRDGWQAGMEKGRLVLSPFANVYDVEWIDAEGGRMSQDIKADFEPLTQILTLHFPYQNTSMRLRKEP